MIIFTLGYMRQYAEEEFVSDYIVEKEIILGSKKKIKKGKVLTSALRPLQDKVIVAG